MDDFKQTMEKISRFFLIGIMDTHSFFSFYRVVMKSRPIAINKEQDHSYGRRITSLLIIQ